MALATNKKISILLIGTFLIGLVVGLVFARMSEQRKESERINFVTQSVNGQEVQVVQKEIPCPREADIRGGLLVEMKNPLVERANELFSFNTKNYMQWGPIGPKIGPWKGQLATQTIDHVTAGMDGSQAMCVYSSLGKDMAILRQDNLDKDCEALTTASFVGFTCPE